VVKSVTPRAIPMKVSGVGVGGVVVGVADLLASRSWYNPKQRELSSISSMASSGTGVAQYISSLAKKALSLGMGIRDGSVEIR